MKNLIISHGDGDGVCACAICYQALDKNAIILFAQPFNIEHRFEELFRNGELPSFDNIYIIDIAYNGNIEAYLEYLRGSNKRVIYIDHHFQSLTIKGRYEGVIDTNYSASTLTAYYFHVLTPLEKIGSACDKTIMLAKLDPLYEEAETLRKALAYEPDDDIFRLKLVKELADGKMPSEIEEVIERGNKCEEERNMLYELALKNIEYEDERVIIVNMKPMDLVGRAGSIASRMAIENKKAVFLIYGNSKTIITARSHRDLDINIGKIMHKYYNGGGHKYAGSGNIGNDNDIGRLIKEIPRIVWNGKSCVENCK